MKLGLHITKFGICFTVIFLINGCSHQLYQVTKYETKTNQSIDENLQEDSTTLALISPYKAQLDNEMSRVISYTPINLDKNGFNSPLANLNCDMVLEEANLIYEKSHHQKIDMCLLNHGGIRTIFGKGNITVGDVYELMPFENQALVVTLDRKKIEEMVEFLSHSDVGHPISGIKFTAGEVNSIQINGKKLEDNQTYTVVTNDYLQRGGDEMYFLANPIKMEFLDEKLRDLMLTYFETHDTVHVNLDKRILK